MEAGGCAVGIEYPESRVVDKRGDGSKGLSVGGQAFRALAFDCRDMVF